MESSRRSCDQVIIGGLSTARLTTSDLVDIMVHDCLASRGKEQLPRLVFSTNGQCISLAGNNPDFCNIIKKAGIIHADGMSVVFTSKLLCRKPLPERIATTDFFHVAAKNSGTHRLRFYLLGGREEVNAMAYTNMKLLYPQIHWVGRHHGFFESHEEDALCEKIRAAKPDILWVGMGRPKQETFAVRNREKLAGIGWIKTCGGLFDFLAGNRKRAPEWMQSAGIEWCWRIFQEPKRLAWRYMSTNLHALWRLAVYTERK